MDYEFVREISRNPFHVLSAVRRRADGAPFLVKAPHRCPPRAIDREMLRREAALLRDLKGEGIPVLAAPPDGAGGAAAPGAHADALVLEPIDGQPLPDLLQGRPLELRLFFEVAARACGILETLHRRDIVCGSFSPASLLYDAATRRLTLVDLGLATRGAAGAGETAPLHLMPERLAYISPEQTGRMNRSIDYRSDFYSLGVTFYELLTGRPPFRTDDPLEAVHWHVARNPVPPHLAGAAVPEAISLIVMKLMSKMAEQRYQSAAGVREDLARCAAQWAERGAIEPFPLARRDVPDRFLIAQKLYGREREVERLRAVFEGVCEGPSALALVGGYAGIGKTTLIQELCKPIVARRGAFVSGKFDPYARNAPCSALVQAFRDLVRQLLAGGEERLALWRERIGAALGANGGVLSEVIPEIDLIIGPQPRPAALGPTESQNRFRLVMQNFVAAMARPDHPLVVFLDDLQWVDAATLDLLEPLLTGAEVRCLLLIGAFRDNEVDSAHPLSRALRALGATGARVETLTLGPLSLDELGQFTSDSLHAEPAAAEPLARLVFERTAGNPFFVIQFLKMLHEGGQLRFDETLRRWCFDIADIRRAPHADNVVDLMTRRIQRLPGPAQRALTLAACLGSPFDPAVLAVAAGLPSSEMIDRIAPALEEGLIRRARREIDTMTSDPGGGTEPAAAFEFLHDRVQQAAYALIPETDRPRLHLDVGRLLRRRQAGGGPADAGPPVDNETLFGVVHHLNLGSGLMADRAERADLASLNLAAGRRAKSSTAWHEALRYLRAGCALLDESRWETDYDMTLALHVEAAECEYLCGDFETAQHHFEDLMARARSRLDKARIGSLMTQQFENMSRGADAVQVARGCLALFGLALPETPEAAEEALRRELDRIQQRLGGQSIESLADLPVMDDPEIRAMMRLLTAVWAPAYVAGQAALTRLISATMVRLSLEHGNTQESAYGYVTHAITVGPIRRDYEAAHAWGLLALAVNERFQDRALRAKVHQQFNAHVNIWRRPMRTSIPHAREACRSGLENGDFTYAGYGAFTECWLTLLDNPDLDRFVQDCLASLALLEKLKMTGFADLQRAIAAAGRALQGRTASRLSLTGDGFDEDQFLRLYGDQPFFRALLHILKLYLCVLLDEHREAVTAAAEARKTSQALEGTIWPVLLDFLEGMALAAAAPRDAAGAGSPAPAAIDPLQASMSRLAASCPENFLCYAELLAAEGCRLRGDGRGALRRYEAAIAAARSGGNLQNLALASQACARHWTEAGHDRIAAFYLKEAHDAFARWGAAARTRDLEAAHPDLFAAAGAMAGAPAASAAASPAASAAASDSPRAAAPAPAAAAVAPAPGEPDPAGLDLATFVKAANALSAGIVLDDLLRRLVTIAIESAGAQRGVFLQEADGRLAIVAEGSVDDEVALPRAVYLDDASPLCASAVRYVRKTRDPVVVADAARDDRFSGDPWVGRGAPRSILCVPVMHKGQIGGILYLENNLTADAFPAERVRVLRILSSQAAIALENARLYEESRQEVERRLKAEEDLREALAEVRQLKDRLQAENVYLQEEIRGEHNFEEMVGTSPALLDLLADVEKVAPTDATVLICGETGTGKELLARALHNRSRRRDRPLAKVNCGAISPGLMESELFGHVKGAFTGALENRIGRFELADGGTLFLDEVGDLPLDTQVKLLRVLQEQEFEPVGSNRTVRVDVRIIAATNRDLEVAVREGRFRADLYFRLNVFPLTGPPLRDRASDIPQLVMFFLARYCKKFGRTINGVSHESMEILMRYSWPGNIRELQNVIERAVVLTQGPVLALGTDLLPPRHQLAPLPLPATPTAPLPARETAPPTAAAPLVPLQEMERNHIIATLRETGGVVEGPLGAAKILNLHPNTLRSRMKKLGIRRGGHDIS